MAAQRQLGMSSSKMRHATYRRIRTRTIHAGIVGPPFNLAASMSVRQTSPSLPPSPTPAHHRQTPKTAAAFTFPTPLPLHPSVPGSSAMSQPSNAQAAPQPPHKEVKPALEVGHRAPSSNKLPFPNGRLTVVLFLRPCGDPCK